MCAHAPVCHKHSKYMLSMSTYLTSEKTENTCRNIFIDS